MSPSDTDRIDAGDRGASRPVRIDMAAKSEAFMGSAPIFAALGDETRLRLVARLCAGGPQSIARRDAGLVRGVRHGRESQWALEPE